jgi:hypothetical protein
VSKLAELVKTHGLSDTRLRADVINPLGVTQIAAHGVPLGEGMSLMKIAHEIDCMNHTIVVCEVGMAATHDATRTG